MEALSTTTAASAIVDAYRADERAVAPDRFAAVTSGRSINQLDDRELVAASVDGNAGAFDELVVRYREKVVRLVSSVIGFRPDVEDIAQDIFIKVYLSLPRFRGDASFSTYLYTTAINRCRDELRRSALRKFFSFEEWFSGSADHPVGESTLEMETDERRVAVRTAMKRLPLDTQMLLYLREIEELSYKELCDIFRVEMGTIKSRLARARGRLRDELMPYMRDGVLPGEVA